MSAAAASTSSEPSKGTILVTGATGFIAGHVILQLLAAGYSVRGSVRALPQPSSSTDQAPRKANVDRTISASAALADMVNVFQGRLQLVVADLTKEGSFNAAAEGCDAIMHVASPVSINPRDPDDVIRPAIEGTRNVLNAALLEARRRGATAEAPYRVIVTSSDAAIVNSGQRPAGKVWSEADWNTTAVPQHHPYDYSKTRAEQVAWEFARLHPELHLVVINPTEVMGPQWNDAIPISSSIVFDLLTGEFPLCPPIHWSVVDVRDVARAHLLALESPDANGRYLLAVPEVSVQQMALWLKQTPDMSQLPIATWRMPAFILYAVALVDSRISFRWAWDHADTHLSFDASKVKNQLHLEFRPTDETIRDTATEMIDRGLVRAKLEEKSSLWPLALGVLAIGALVGAYVYSQQEQ